MFNVAAALPLLEEIAFSTAFFAYFICAFLYFYILFWRREEPGAFSSAFLWTGAASQTLALVFRSQKAGYAPMSNMFESLSVFSLMIIIFYIWVEFKYGIKSLGPFVISIAFTMIAIASVLPRDIAPLVPALQSYWLALHVLVTFAGEAAFAVSYVAALMYIITPAGGGDDPRRGLHSVFVTLNAGLFLSVISYFITALLVKRAVVSGAGLLAWVPAFVFIAGALAFNFSKNMILLMMPPADTLEDISYRAVGFGLPVFTLGALVFGAIWAHRAWGSYWSWDPKETWALITWFIYAAYLHARCNAGLKGRAAAYITALGFISTLFTYFGVNYLLSGLHSYGKF